MSEISSKPQSQTSGLAVGSLVCGVLFIGLPAIVLGHIALRKIARSDGSLSGRGLALAGTILGYLSVVALTIIVILSGLVVGGSSFVQRKAAIDRAMVLAAEGGAKKSVLLPVSAPFHCSLMQPAAEAMRAALADVAIAPPVVPLIANVRAKPVSDPETIRGLLIEQVTGRVRWRESVLEMKAMGVTHLVELGAGKVLSGLARRIDRELTAVAVGTPAGVEAFLAS